jgi:hypothetical protein
MASSAGFIKTPHRRKAKMQTQKYFHKCGHPILEVKRNVGPVMNISFVDADDPFSEDKDGKKSLKVIKQCPECGGTIKPERLLTKKPDMIQENRPTGYIPAKI